MVVLGRYSKFWRVIILSFVTGISSLWLDGESVESQDVGSYELDTDAEIRIGAVDHDGRFFRGSISCVQIYNRALSNPEIAAAKERCSAPRWALLKIILMKPNIAQYAGLKYGIWAERSTYCFLAGLRAQKIPDLIAFSQLTADNIDAVRERAQCPPTLPAFMATPLQSPMHAPRGNVPTIDNGLWPPLILSRQSPSIWPPQTDSQNV